MPHPMSLPAKAYPKNPRPTLRQLFHRVLQPLGVTADTETATRPRGNDAARGKDAHLVDQEIQRSFEEPDYSLLSGTQPHEIGCDVPLKGRIEAYRRVSCLISPRTLVTIKFILGTPTRPEDPHSSEGVARAELMKEVKQEMEEQGDMTHEYFKWSPRSRPRFVMKADDDTILVMPNLISAFKDLDCATNVYWGTSAGRSRYFGDYFRGLAYAMSWPLISWIGNADMPLAHTIKIEDARTGQWLRALDPVTDPINRIDMGWTMGDWNQLDVSVETVALHWCKLDELYDIWAAADRPYTYEHGKLTPENAAKEHQRQKDLGWDVSGNIPEDG
ncbi:hypothetical protein DB88DRAFT_503663 [Papiliotrema laurentii]|uniref:Hexosyltransferase n=1 Tax=Papiliotrema laurentii TaxID=5418 RepID=A0AAD9FLA8_PAPLA|nr:hypothetical protein DB88DRAFT_503663 [Papiliotrema laurentii]